MRNVAQAVMWPSRLRTCCDHDRIEWKRPFWQCVPVVICAIRGDGTSLPTQRECLGTKWGAISKRLEAAIKSGSKLGAIYIEGVATMRFFDVSDWPLDESWALSAHLEEGQLVTVQVAHIATIEGRHACPRRAFVGGTQFQSLGV